MMSDISPCSSKLGERVPCEHQVVGANPTRGSMIRLNALWAPWRYGDGGASMEEIGVRSR